MKSGKCSAMRAVNDVLSLQPDEQYFIERLYYNVYDGVLNLCCFMSKTMRKRVFDIARAITTVVVYRLYDVDGRENEQQAKRFLYQFKCLRVFVNNLCNCLTIHDSPEEMTDKIKTIGKPLFDFINKKY